jgi:two-component system alkaline phosphatase synthesis response regulator PhoP
MNPTTTVLVTEDDADILELITYSLETEGFRVHSAKNGMDALSVLSDESVDLAILDVMLPDMTGIELCRKIKREERLENIPVLFVTAKDAETDKLIGFKVGADDYLTKPFSPKELVARAKALVRRSKGGKDRFLYRGLEIHFDRHMVEVENIRVNLTPREFMVLKVLIEGQKKTIARATLLERAWGMESKSGLRSVDVTVTRLRDKIKPYGKCIRTVTGFGYQWDPDGYVPAEQPEASAAAD